jgi:hypothetical protein
MSIKTLSEINESSADEQASIYADKYADQVSAYESSSSKAKIQESVSAYEIVALGQQLDQFSNYAKFTESQGNLGSLGAIPQVALDVITASVGSSILPLLASIQPMAEEHGIVYYKAIKAMQTSGGYTAGDNIANPLARDNPGNGTLGRNRKAVTLATTPGATPGVSYSGNIADVPLRPFMLEVSVAGVGYGKDNGNGQILGFGFSGTVNYVTGAWTIVFADTPPISTALAAIYDIDVDGAANIEKIQGSLLTKDVRATIFALASDVGAFANYAFSQRFGKSAIDEVASDLTNEITRILNTNAVLAIVANLPVGATDTFFRVPPTGISYAEHKLTFIDSIATAEQRLHSQSGAPTANRYIAGRVAAQVLRGMPDFQIAPDAATVSVGLYGFYDGVPVIRATGVVGDNDLILCSNTGNYFNAPLAWAPFMPLMVTSTVQSANNPFRSTTAAGVWGGLVALNGSLTTKLVLQNTQS